jgi:hypothetical protein
MTAGDLAADPREQTARQVKQALETSTNFEWRHRRKDGTQLSVAINTAFSRASGTRTLAAKHLKERESRVVDGGTEEASQCARPPTRPTAAVSAGFYYRQ